jgi:hypothetical protein
VGPVSAKTLDNMAAYNMALEEWVETALVVYQALALIDPLYLLSASNTTNISIKFLFFLRTYLANYYESVVSSCCCSSFSSDSVIFWSEDSPVGS